jgi:hypothetical protein
MEKLGIRDSLRNVKLKLTASSHHLVELIFLPLTLFSTSVVVYFVCDLLRCARIDFHVAEPVQLHFCFLL